MSSAIAQVSVHSQELASLLSRHRAFWEFAPQNSFLRTAAIHEPSLPVALPQRDGSFLTHTERLTPDMIDPAALIAQVEHWDPDLPDAAHALDKQYLAHAGRGDAPPSTCPFSKIPWVEAMLGCPIMMTEGQIWNEHYKGDPQEVIDRGLNFEHNAWYQLYLEFLRQMQDKLSRRFIVMAATLIRGVSDLAAAVMGVQEACVGWIDQPAFMARLLRVCTDAVLTVWEGGYKALRPFQGGYLDSWGVWSPAPAVATQADHSSLLSAKMYQRQILPFDREVIRCQPMSLLHLHNCGLHVAPVLVEVPELTVIEVFMDPYPTGARKMWEIEMLQMIQQHKPLLLDVNAPDFAESEWLLSQLDKRGLSFNARFGPEELGSLPADYPPSRRWVLKP